MKISIYQINHDRDINNVCFIGYDRLTKYQNTNAIDSSIYDKIYVGEVGCETLDDIYEKFNEEHPQNFKGYSLSVSDVIETYDEKGHSKFSFVDSFGFKDVSFEPSKTQLSKHFTNDFVEQNEGGIKMNDVAQIRDKYPEGTIIELIEMCGEPRMTAGLKGTVTHVDDMGHIHMRWENGSTLALVPDEDSFNTVEPIEKISVLLVEPHKYPKVVEIENTLVSMQKTVGGNIEAFSPYDDGTVIICNEDGKTQGLPLNRAVYAEPEKTEMTYNEIKSVFRESEKKGEHINAHIVFTKESFDKSYTETERTYVVNSNNKAFQENMGGYSIYACSLDGSDPLVRLERYMKAEHGGKNGWEIEKCFLVCDEKEMVEIIAGTFFVVGAPEESENFASLTDEQVLKYDQLFKNPERFYRDSNNKIVAESFTPVNAKAERDMR